MSNKNIEYNPNPCLVEDSILEIREALEVGCCNWLEKAYPLAFKGEVTKGDSTHFFPRIYLNDGRHNYIDVMPDQKLQSFCFFELNGTYTLDRVSEETTSSVSILFWANLKKIDARDYDYKGELIQDSIRCLTQSTVSCDIDTIEVTENFEDIFSKYSYEQTDMQFFMYPYTSWKLTFTVTQDSGLSCCLPFRLDECEEFEAAVIAIETNRLGLFEIIIDDPERVSVGVGMGDYATLVGDTFSYTFPNAMNKTVKISVEDINEVTSIRILDDIALTSSLDLSKLTSLKNFDIQVNIVDVILPSSVSSLIMAGGTYVNINFADLNPNLADFSIDIQGLLTVPQLDQALIDLDTNAVSTTTGLIDFSSNGVPTGAGATAKSNLISKGFIVNTD